MSENERPYIWHDSILNLENEKIFDFRKNDFDIEEYLHFTESQYIHYYLKEEEKCVPFILKIENICGTIDRGEKDRNHYFKSASLLQTGYVHSIFNRIEAQMCNYDCHSVIDSGIFQIDSEERLPLNKIVYMRNLIVVFEKIQDVYERRKKKRKVVARIISGDILLNKNL